MAALSRSRFGRPSEEPTSMDTSNPYAKPAKGAEGRAGSKRPALAAITNKQDVGVAPAPAGKPAFGSQRPFSFATASPGPTAMVLEPTGPVHRDIDMEDRTNPLQVSEYVEEIYQVLRDCETKRMPIVGYMNTQSDITGHMRAVLVDWLVEVSEEYRLVPETLYLAVQFIDRFLSHVQVQRSKLQLVGMTAMLVAAKYEEIYPPMIKDFIYISDNTYNHEEVVSTEQFILQVLQFNLTSATIYSFLRRFMKAADTDARTNALISYYAELTLQELNFVRFKPSVVAAAAVSLGLHACGNEAWTPTLAFYTKYTAADIRECVEELYTVVRNAEGNHLQAVREKYSHSKCQRVSALPAPQSHPYL